jgi:hypothetical protein
MSTNEELLRRKSSSSGLESRQYGCRDLSRWPRGTLYPQKLAVTSPKSGGLSVGIVRSRTQATEFFSCTGAETKKQETNIETFRIWKSSSRGNRDILIKFSYDKNYTWVRLSSEANVLLQINSEGQQRKRRSRFELAAVGRLRIVSFADDV